MLVRYKWSEYHGMIIEKIFLRETKEYYYWFDHGSHRCPKHGWYGSKKEALEARVKWCDEMVKKTEEKVKFWRDAAKKAFVLLCRDLAGMGEKNDEQHAGERDGRSEGAGDQGTEATQESASRE